MSKENQNASEDYVNRSLNRIQKSFRTWVVATIVILIAESAYFWFIHSAVAEGMEGVPEIVSDYQEDFNATIAWAEKFPKKADYSDYLKKAEKYLKVVIEAKKNHAKELAKFESSLDQINAAREPEDMAHLFSTKVKRELNWQNYMITSYARKYLDNELKELPKWTREAYPRYGAELRFSVKNWISHFCTATSDDFGSTFDAFLADHKDQIQKFSETTDDEALLDQLDEEFIDDLANFLETTPVEKLGTLKKQSDNFLHRIQAANELLKPLVRKKTTELTAEERRLRRAVGLFMHHVKTEKLTPKIQPEPEKN